MTIILRNRKASKSAVGWGGAQHSCKAELPHEVLTCSNLRKRKMRLAKMRAHKRKMAGWFGQIILQLLIFYNMLTCGFGGRKVQVGKIFRICVQRPQMSRQGSGGHNKKRNRAGNSGPIQLCFCWCQAGRWMLNFSRMAMSVAASNRAAARCDRISSFFAVALAIRSGLSRSAHSLGEVRSPRAG